MRGDFRNKRRKPANWVEIEAGIAANLATRRFRQHGPAEPELRGFLQPRGGLRHLADHAGERDLAKIDRVGRQLGVHQR